MKKLTPLTVVLGHSGELLQQGQQGLAGPADALLQVTRRVAGATVEAIAAAHGLHMIQEKKKPQDE